jgi:hypothetical protein
LQQNSAAPVDGSEPAAVQVSFGSTACVGVVGGGQAIPTDGYAQPETAWSSVHASMSKPYAQQYPSVPSG